MNPRSLIQPLEILLVELTGIHTVLLFLETYCHDCLQKKKLKNLRDKEFPSSIELKLERPQNFIISSASTKFYKIECLINVIERERERVEDEQQYIYGA